MNNKRIFHQARPSAGALAWAFAALLLAACQPGDANPPPVETSRQEAMTDSNKYETATFGAGCFWCVEAVLQRLDGVQSVQSGYMGGHVENPSYQEVCRGQTGHAEVTQVSFDPQVITYEELLEVFWQLHDPTTLNRQGADVGPQYRSAIFYHDDTQRQTAEASKQAANAQFDRPIVTEITAASTFYPAEDYHQDYYDRNRNAGYCRFVIAPKLKKLNLQD